MKRLIILFCTTIAIASCTSQQSGDSRLRMADSLVSLHPYEALVLLDSLDERTLSSTFDSAFYNLLLVEALHGAGNTLGNDSLIFISERYFEQTKDKSLLARTYLQHGISLSDRGQLTKAINYLKKAESMLDLKANHPIAYILYSAIARTNAAAQCKGLALSYEKRALAVCDINVTRRVETMNRIATLYDDLDQPDSFKTYIRRCLSNSRDTIAQADVMVNIGRFYLRQGQREMALHYLRATLNSEAMYEAAGYLGELFDSEGDRTKAQDYYFMAMESCLPEMRTHAYQRLIHYAEISGNHRLMTDLSLRLNQEYEKYQAVEPPEIAKYQADFDAQQASARSHKQLAKVAFIIGILVMVIVVGLLLHRRKMRRYRRLLEQTNADYLDTLKRHETAQRELTNLREVSIDGDAVIAQKTAEIDALQQRLAQFQEDKMSPTDWNIGDSLLNSDVVFRMHDLAAQGRTAMPTDWQQLVEAIAPQLPGLMAKLSAPDCHLSDREMRVCLLIRLRFIPSEIATLVIASPQVITNIRVRLLEKIYRRKGGARMFDELIRAEK